VVRDADPPPRFGSRIPRHTLRVPRPPAPRFTCSRTAPPSREPLPSSPATMSAAPASRASRVRRTATLRGSTGAESITTSANALLRSRTSAHQAARVGSRGRTIQSPSSLPNGAQSRGASVRIASMYATHPDRSSVSATMRRRRVAFPLPRAPTISVNRPRGSPPPTSPASSSATPVGSASALVPGGAERGRGRRSTRDCGSIGRSASTAAAAQIAAEQGELSYPE
jgi:hypothetical protein